MKKIIIGTSIREVLLVKSEFFPAFYMISLHERFVITKYVYFLSHK